MSTAGTSSLLYVTDEQRASNAREQDISRLRRLVNDIDASRFAPYALGVGLGFLLFITLIGVVGPLVTPIDPANQVSPLTIFLIVVSTQLILILLSTLGFKRSVYNERSDAKVQELRSLMSLIDPSYRNTLEALKESDPPLAKRICKYTKGHQAKETVK